VEHSPLHIGEQTTTGTLLGNEDTPEDESDDNASLGDNEMVYRDSGSDSDGESEELEGDDLVEIEDDNDDGDDNDDNDDL
jgi:hypothetical protein